MPTLTRALLAGPAGHGASSRRNPRPRRSSPDLVKLLREMKAADTDQLAVSEEDGRFLRVMVASNRARRALEIGGANGYSAIWIGLGLRETGGHLTSIEFDPARAKTAASNIRRAGLADVVTVVAGDAFKEIPKLAGDVDFVFLDAWKRDYKRFLDVMLPRMTPGRALSRAQRRQQTGRDARFSLGDSRQSRPVHRHRHAVGRRDVGLL